MGSAFVAQVEDPMAVRVEHVTVFVVARRLGDVDAVSNAVDDVEIVRREALVDEFLGLSIVRINLIEDAR